MNICFFCDTIFTFGGVQRVTAVIACALSPKHNITILTLDKPDYKDMSMYNFNQYNIDFEFLAYTQPPVYKRIPEKVYSFLYKTILPKNKYTSGIYSFTSFPKSNRKQLITALNEKQYDVIIGVHAFLSIRLATIRPKLNAPGILGWMHNSYQAFFVMRPSYLEKLKEHFSFQMQKLDKVIVLSQTDANLYQKQLSIDATVIYNPLTITPQNKSKLNSKIFLAVGRFAPLHKGFDILIEAFADFSKNNKEWLLHIVGEGPEESSLRELISKHKLKDRVKIFPFTKEIEKHYADASVYVLSSRWEGFGLVLLEAMSHRLPIIASDIPVVKELLSQHKNTLLFQSENSKDLSRKMLKIAQIKDLTPLGNESYKIAQQFHIDNIIHQWENLLTSSFSKA